MRRLEKMGGNRNLRCAELAVAAGTCLLALGYFKYTKAQTASDFVVFPKHGYLLMYDRQDLRWGRVSEPGHKWETIVDGSFETADEFQVNNTGGGFRLERVEGAHVRSIDARSGAKYTYPIEPGQVPNDTRFAIRGHVFVWKKDRWFVTQPLLRASHPLELRDLPGPPNSRPLSVPNDRTALFYSFTELSSEANGDICAVDLRTGAVRTVLSMATTLSTPLVEEVTGRLYFLNKAGQIERWAWQDERLVKTDAWRLPSSINISDLADLTSLAPPDWVLFRTLVEDPAIPLLSRLPRSCYYAMNTRSGKVARVLDCEPNQVVVGWISD